MGILPLKFINGQNALKLNLEGKEKYSIEIDDCLRPNQLVIIEVWRNFKLVNLHGFYLDL
jgi:aconitase A